MKLFQVPNHHLKIATYLMTIFPNTDVINTNEKGPVLDIPIPNIII